MPCKHTTWNDAPDARVCCAPTPYNTCCWRVYTMPLHLILYAAGKYTTVGDMHDMQAHDVE
jgi:hypothetical protein